MKRNGRTVIVIMVLGALLILILGISVLVYNNSRGKGLEEVHRFRIDYQVEKIEIGHLEDPVDYPYVTVEDENTINTVINKINEMNLAMTIQETRIGNDIVLRVYPKDSASSSFIAIYPDYIQYDENGMTYGTDHTNDKQSLEAFYNYIKDIYNKRIA